MPVKNSLKTYIENGFYHVYNRGVEKRNIFLDEQDYSVFLSYLKLYLSPTEETIKNTNENDNLDDQDKNIKIYKINSINNYFNKIELLCYVLMPNHFHLELKQIGKKDMGHFMQSLITKYTMYFNRKYKRVGSLFQGRYKAVFIHSLEYLLDLSRYIHLNPFYIINKNQKLISYPWSSYNAYIYNHSIKWLNKNYLLNYFNQTKKTKYTSYQNFIDKYLEEEVIETKEYNNLLLDLGQTLT
ncbi:hypothetical protein CO005_03055 [Candidatus Roizmanbacteria bacterium CG_4_8_14_3_um_filter_34_9]|uniref:Transposase IS200-like domain-containing protein n=3 Tax=Candidatus Roizmaniibacteriota TaxID=1752723 RepID=A0A2M7AUU1_9BACT|nr:MAG: hypothetical protein COT02_02230 [Candidatus Roizmanbacteria bacterium CG07_land_8_20_14_0_80_34_15]PIU74323.1 MAG: hypothetical protein COS77_02220 [Candidatus Roizmanbacteria bacterium CG06_land_8_20_14_3_00_34_14]PIW73139.1 MAG: hypothetical protein CO005_03055 [Candidatus Roizmanbacteria bacterium CG_4_8_14_3_um_filter_34_9]